jgi:glycosyltransferase involved in cell wall biosynthesis
MPHPLRILYIHDYPHREGGGIEVQTYADALELAKRGHTVTIATTRVSSETFSGGSRVAYPVSPVPGVFLDVIDSIAKLEALIARADITHVQATFSLRPATMAAMKILREQKRDYFVALRTTIGHLPFSRLATEDLLVREELLQTFKDNLNDERCHILGVSEVLRESLLALGVLKPMTVVSNGKDWDSFAPKGKNIQPVDITYLGEISWMKGLHVLLGALTMLKKDMPNSTVRFIGNGQNSADVKALASSLDLPISFLDYVSNGDIPDYLAATKLVVVPSLTESFCNVAMEALGLGMPIVASATEGLIELTENGKLGLLFERGNAYDCYQKLKLMLTESAIRKKFSNPEIRKTILTKYTIERRIKTLERIYERLFRKAAVLKSSKRASPMQLGNYRFDLNGE